MNEQRIIVLWRRLVSSAALIPVMFSFGCATASKTSPEFNIVSLELIDSTAVKVSKTWIERDSTGMVTVAGFVTRQPGAKDTSNVHLDVMGYDAQGNTLIATQGRYRGEYIPRRKPPRRGSSRFMINIETYTSDVELIEVRAHEGPFPHPL